MAHTSQIGPPFSQILDFWHQNSWLCFFWCLSGPSKAIFDIFSKIFEKLSIKEFWRSLSMWWKIGKNIIFSIYWRKCWFCWLNLDSIGSQLSFEVYISISSYSNFQIFQIFGLWNVIFDPYDSRIHSSQNIQPRWLFLVSDER